MESINEEVLNNEPYALRFPDDVYSREEQEHIMVINELRKDIEAEKVQHGITQKKQRQLNAYKWVLRLIDEITKE